MKKLLVAFPVRGKNKKYLLALMSLLFSISLLAQTEENCTREMFSSDNLMKLQKLADSSVSHHPGNLPTYRPFQTYDTCVNPDSNRRGIAFIHGLGGSVEAWSKQIEFTDNQYHTACFGVNYNSYESSFHLVGIKVKNDLTQGFSNVDETHKHVYNTERCPNDDYVIAHSQGGIAARFLDMKWDQVPDLQSGSFGARRFYGLVTFGTPHAGADVALTAEEHYAFVADVISSVILYSKNEIVYDLSSSFVGTFFSNGIYNFNARLDSIIKNELAPLMLASVHTPTLNEMRPGGQLIDDLNKHWGSLHRVAFYGVEDEPECWRVMDQVITKGAEEYPLWGAQPDEEFMRRMEEVRGIHTLKIQENENRIKQLSNVRRASWVGPLAGKIVVALGTHLILNKQIQNIEKENEQRAKSVEFLNNANTQWRYLIGSYHRDSFETVIDTYHRVTYQITASPGNPWFPGHQFTIEQDFDDLAYAQAFALLVNGQVTPRTRIRKVIKFYPSDGVVLARSQQAFPGIEERNIDYMPHNNHFQERNSSETKKVLIRLYEGRKYDSYFKIIR